MIESVQRTKHYLQYRLHRGSIWAHVRLFTSLITQICSFWMINSGLESWSNDITLLMLISLTLVLRYVYHMVSDHESVMKDWISNLRLLVRFMDVMMSVVIINATNACSHLFSRIILRLLNVDGNLISVQYLLGLFCSLILSLFAYKLKQTKLKNKNENKSDNGSFGIRNELISLSFDCFDYSAHFIWRIIMRAWMEVLLFGHRNTRSELIQESLLLAISLTILLLSVRYTFDTILKQCETKISVSWISHPCIQFMNESVNRATMLGIGYAWNGPLRVWISLNFHVFSDDLTVTVLYVITLWVTVSLVMTILYALLVPSNGIIKKNSVAELAVWILSRVCSDGFKSTVKLMTVFTFGNAVGFNVFEHSTSNRYRFFQMVPDSNASLTQSGNITLVSLIYSSTLLLVFDAQKHL